MNTKATVSVDGETITIHIPMAFRKRGGRKMLVTPSGAPWAPRPRVDNALVKAVARAFRWQRKFESGRYANLTELAAAEKVTLPYLTNILQIARLAPDLVEMVLNGRQPADLTLRDLTRSVPIEWDAQRTLALQPTEVASAGCLAQSDPRVPHST